MPRDNDNSNDILDSAATPADRTSPGSAAIRTGEDGRAVNSQNEALRPGSADSVTPAADATPGTPDSTDSGASAAAAGSSIGTEPDRTDSGVAPDRARDAGNVVDSVNATGTEAERERRGVIEGVDATGNPADTARPAGGVVTDDMDTAATASDRTDGSAVAPSATRFNRGHNDARMSGGNRSRPITTDSRQAGDLVIDPAAAETMDTR